MKVLKIIMLLAVSVLISCQREGDKEEILKQIQQIENNLLPKVIIEGRDVDGFNIQERMKHYSVPGVSMAFLDQGEIVWARGYGYTSFDSTRAVDEFTLFQAASISKPVAAMAALSLVEEGTIGLDEDVNLYLKGWQVEENEFTTEKKVTLRRILSHSAGLTVHGFRGYTCDEEVPDVVKILNGETPANSDRIVPFTVPGTRYSYSGGGYTVMQKMLTDLSGKKFPELMEARVLSKIGMKSSTYEQPLPPELQGNAASAHTSDGGKIQGKWHTYPEMAAAGLWTTPSDLLAYAREVQDSYAGKSKLVLSQDMVKEMLTPQMNSHGLGPAVGGSGEALTFSHGGSNAGFQCDLMAFTRLGQGVAIMTNGDRGRDLMMEILRSFSGFYDWDLYNPEVRSITVLDESDLKLLAGRYVMNWEGQELVVELEAAGDHLRGRQVWNNFSFKIHPESETEFFNMDDGVSFTFVRKEDGSIRKVLIFEGGREYRFIRIHAK